MAEDDFDNIFPDPEIALKAEIARRKMIQAVFDAKPISQAAESCNITTSQAKDLLAEPATQKIFTKILEDHGLDDDYLASKLKKLSEAKKTLFFQKDGIVTDEREVESLEIQQKILNTILQVKGHLKEDKSTTINIDTQIMSAVVAALNKQED
ncbi:hypothetical protein M0R04_09320 [Candidatus Dojkabacteria bacterium]|jgi:hypothetical protein|nr:hypothetical protein [Candidatus Dojkabacteria bacterium]